MPRIPDVIVGHDKQKGELLRDIASGNVAHAYLFTGAPHLGKLTIAQWFGTLLLSEHVAPEMRGRVKQEIEKFIHPEFLCLDDLWIEEVNEDWAVIGKSSNTPQQHRSKAPAARTDTISIEDVRALAERLHETGAGPHLVCIIRGIERMQSAAANAFLKILEEPPSRVVFLLTTDNVNLVLPTVLSRVRVLRFSPVTRKDMEPLVDGQDESDAAFALHIAQGAPGMLTRLLEDPELLRTHRQMHAQAKQFWQSTTLKDRLAWLTGVMEKTKSPDLALLHLGLTLREYPDPLFRAKTAGAYADLLEKLETNAHRGLLYERFALAIDHPGC